MKFLFLILLIRAIVAQNNLIKFNEKDGSYDSLRFTDDGKGYEYRYLTPDMSSKHETGKLDDQENMQVNGTYSYDTKDGYEYRNTYRANENGFMSKIFFGKILRLQHEIRIGQRKPEKVFTSKGIDPVLLCSLIGGGCK